jgi:hypothetical protein
VTARKIAREVQNLTLSLAAGLLIVLLGLSVQDNSDFTRPARIHTVAEYLGQYHPPTDRRLCIEDHGWTRWNDALPGVTQRLRDHGVNVVNWDDCSSQPDDVVAVITTVDSPESFCARTIRGAYVNGVAQGRTYIQMNMRAAIFGQCHATPEQRQHVISHETGHYLGLIHNTAASVMGAWQYNWYTARDYADLATIF